MLRKIAVGIVWSVFAMLILVQESSALTLTSTSFKEGEKLPVNAGYEMGNTSPELNWSDIPNGTLSFALVVDDPDANGWSHWVIYNIPPTETKLKGNFASGKELKNGTRQGSNDFKEIGYGGPCPPSGTHRYNFKLYALDILLDLAPGSSKDSLLKAIKGHVLAEAKLTGKYSR